MVASDYSSSASTSSNHESSSSAQLTHVSDDCPLYSRALDVVFRGREQLWKLRDGDADIGDVTFAIGTLSASRVEDGVSSFP